MKCIFKYTLPITDETVISMPQGAEILSIQEQRGAVYIWAVVDPDAPMVDRHFIVKQTGHPMQTPVGDFIATFQIHFPPFRVLVFHVFEAAAVTTS